MRFIVDMNLSVEVAVTLREAGHDAVHVRELGNEALPDVDIFARAAAERRIVVTFDLDFSDLVAASGGRSVSVLLFRLRLMAPSKVLQRLKAALAETGAMLDEGAVVTVEDARTRVRRLPIGN